METIVLDYKPQPHQCLFHNDTSRFRIIAGGRRTGKTKCVIQEAIKHSIEASNNMTYLVSPTFKLAREILFDEFLTYYDDLEPVIKSVHHSHMKVKFTNNSVMYFKGADNPDSLRGPGLTLYIADEAAFHKADTWKLVVRPALSDKKGRAVMISTPNGRNHFYDTFVNKGWTPYHWITSINELIDDEEIEMAKSEMSDVDFRQEYMAEFITRAGRVYDDFDDNNIINKPHITDKTRYNYYIGMDFGYATITCACLMAVDRYENRVIMIDELYVTRKQIDEVIALLLDMISTHKLNMKDINQIYTDPAGNSEELTSGTSPVDSIRKVGFKVTNKGSRINPGLALVRSFIRNAQGIRRFYVTSNCVEAIRSFEGYQYDSNRITKQIKEEPLKDGIYDHMPDCIRYFFVNKFDAAKYVAKTPDQGNYNKSMINRKVWKRCVKCHKQFLSSTPLNQPPFLCNEHKEKE